MYTTSFIGPVFVVHQLANEGLDGTKVVIISSEAGSITLRHPSEGGGNYAHHASKAALTMAGKLLSLDFKDLGFIVSLVHPGFMRTEMTRAVGFDQFWDQGGAVEPHEAAELLINWVDELTMSKSGEFWAPREACELRLVLVTQDGEVLRLTIIVKATLALQRWSGLPTPCQLE